MNKQARVIVHGNAGQGVAENMMSGEVHVRGDASQAAGASGCGGLLVVDGNASARCGISMKGIDIVVKGSVGHLSAFMAQAGNLVVLGDAGEALGDSIYEAQLYVRGAVKSLGADCVEKPLEDHHAGGDCGAYWMWRASTEASMSDSSAVMARREASTISISTTSVPTDVHAGPLDSHAAAQVGNVR